MKNGIHVLGVALATALLLGSAAAQTTNSCITVTPYGQRDSTGQDMAKHGKTLGLAFRFLPGLLEDTMGMVDVSGGEPGMAYGIVLGARSAEIRFPWGDTLLTTHYIAMGSRVFDSSGSDHVSLRMGPAWVHLRHSFPEVEFFMQAFAMTADGRPLTSHGLRITVCAKPSNESSAGLDADVPSFTRRPYTTHPVNAQLLLGIIGAQGASVMAWITLPQDNWSFEYDDTDTKGDVTRVMLSVRAPSDPKVKPPARKTLKIPLDSSSKRIVEVYVADRQDGVPPKYFLAAYLIK